MSKTFRQTFHCPLFGQPKSLNHQILPSHADVLRHYHYVRYDLAMASTCPKKNVSLSSVANVIADEIEAIYVKASFPMVSKTRICNLSEPFMISITIYVKNLIEIKYTRKNKRSTRNTFLTVKVIYLMFVPASAKCIFIVLATNLWINVFVFNQL